MIRRPPRSTPLYSSAASDVYKRQVQEHPELTHHLRELAGVLGQALRPHHDHRHQDDDEELRTRDAEHAAQYRDSSQTGSASVRLPADSPGLAPFPLSGRTPGTMRLEGQRLAPRSRRKAHSECGQDAELVLHGGLHRGGRGHRPGPVSYTHLTLPTNREV